ncbi:endonuclease/exonuclease/phosphatase family protein [Bacteroides caecigallinarum]|uniref:endonuclease/exonuclease/phosphatase family protein n=1 Tax=Bacteroides caecigallinarum TaxID=1411144 RepID=UPI00195C30E2|nr:endonuclease/exonuclease/phosphatase family protein [Bacteroides caecigallinarum]MBM6864900.1 endonuclease/exonuclease/phosphatase family protein [Bacteroides caecigallinarum]
MTYNIRNAIGIDKKFSTKRIADVIRNSKADVVAVQEVDSMTARSKGRYVLGEIADYLSMYHSFAPALDYDGGKYGIGILSKERPISLSKVALPGTEESRMLIIAEFSDFVFCCTHLSLTYSDRIKSIDVLKEKIKGIKKPVFLAGDFNDSPNSEFMKKLKKDFRLLSNDGVFTWPADNPEKTIDYIMVLKKSSEIVSKIRGEVLNEPMASDHRPVLVNIILSQYSNNR